MVMEHREEYPSEWAAMDVTQISNGKPSPPLTER
jgi:hypothetical protein